MSIPDNGLPGIDASVQDLDMATRFAWDAIRQRNFEEPFLFRRGGIVRIENDDDGRPIIREVTADRMRFELAKSAHYYRQGPQGQVPAHPPMANVKNMLADPIPPVPVLGRVTEVPVFGREGTLQTKPGYHPGTKNYYAPAPGFEVPAIPDRPTNDDMVRALQFIVHDLLGDFPFTGESERAHAVALYLLPYVRDLIDGPTPHHLVEKPCPGSGASLLVDALTFPVMGRSIAALTEGRDEDEWRKRLTSKISTGSPYILIDNLRRTLDSAAVSSAITCMSWEDRRLGSTEMVTFPVRCAWISTGNNPALSAEISRRTIRIRIDARIDRPWLRNGFRHPDLRGWVKEYRKDLVWAALVLIQRWLSEGRPRASSVRLGMFECWSDTMAGILKTADIRGFLENLDEFYNASDAEGAVWTGFISAWAERFGEMEITSSDLFTVADSLDLGTGSERSQKTKLGKILSRARDRRHGDYQIVQAALRNGLQLWKLNNVLHEQAAEQ